jgi:hypothetical protein
MIFMMIEIEQNLMREKNNKMEKELRIFLKRI